MLARWLYGLTVAVADERGGDGLVEIDRPDVVVHSSGRRAIGAEQPPGRLVAGREPGSSRGYWLVEHADGFVLRLPGLAEFALDPALGRIAATLAPEVDERYLPILLTGNVMNCLLVLRGSLVLHASAASHNGVVTAFVADTGGGKSTIAALACGAGARFVTDDLLRVEIADGEVTCFGAASVIRLRETARSLAGHAAVATATMTADGRVGAVPLSIETAGPLSLGRVVFPLPNREVERPLLTELSRSQALLALGRLSRMPGLVDRERLTRQFEGLARLVELVPHFTAQLPWGPPFGDLPIDVVMA